MTVFKRHVTASVCKNKSDTKCMFASGKNSCDDYTDFEIIKKLFTNEQEIKLYNTFNEQIEKKIFTKIKLICSDFYSCPFLQ